MQNDPERNRHTDRLRERRAERRTGRSEMHRAHEEVIEHDIRRARNRDEVHRTFRVTEAAENRADDVVCCDERDTGEADGEVGHRALDRLRRGRNQTDNRTDTHHQYARQHDRQHHEQRYRVADAVRGLLAALCADRLRDADRCAHRKTHQHDCHHMHDLSADGYRRCRGNTLEPADDEQVGHAVQRLQKIGKQIRYRIVNDVPKYASCCKITFHRVNFVRSARFFLSAEQLLLLCLYYKLYVNAEKDGRQVFSADRPLFAFFSRCARPKGP